MKKNEKEKLDVSKDRLGKGDESRARAASTERNASRGKGDPKKSHEHSQIDESGAPIDMDEEEEG
jgi:hypothetical protein